MKLLCPSLLLAVLFGPAAYMTADAAQAELKDLSINGGLQDGKARLVIEAQLKGLTEDKEKLLFATTLQHAIQVGSEKVSHTITATIDILQGEPKELPFTLSGDGEILKVTGEALQDWSVRSETNGTRTLVLRPRRSDKPLTQLAVTVTAEHELKSWNNPLKPLTLTPAQPALFNGYVKVESARELDVQATNTAGLVPIEHKFLPGPLRTEAKADGPEPLAFRFHGTAYSLPLNVTFADPEARRVVLRDAKLSGQFSDTTAAFTLTATAHVKNPRGAALTLLSGGVAVTELEPHPDWRFKFEQGRFVLVFDKPGEFPLHLKFNAAVRQTNGWNRLDFRVAPSALQPIVFQGLGPDTQFEFAGAARPERRGSEFVSFLPADGAVKLSWKEARAEIEGKLFFSAEMLSQISISPGLMRQFALVEFKVMQGELNRIVLLLRGQGNVTRVQGASVLSWNVEPMPNSANRRLIVHFNQPQKDAVALQVQLQTELGAFPQAVDAIQLQPEGATRFAGHFRVVNEGAVRLEVVQSAGLSQISPEQFPESDATKALFGTQASQRFAFRFSSADFTLRVQADNVLPELSVSHLLAYHLGETELAIDAELELDIREAPVRELLLRVPKGYALARLTAPGLSDYFSTDNANETNAELRLVYGQPMLGRQVVQFRLERNAAFDATNWALPRIEVTKAKSTRGHVAVSADAGFRLSPERTQGLTEIATAFFPRKITGIQAAFRLSDAAWQVTMRVERLAQSVQADVFHLFSIGEGIAYGSSTINYLISGAPLATFRFALSGEHTNNVEFIGKDVRNWQQTTNGYVVYLHTPVAGPYTLLATYERPFKAQGDTLTFTGARPLDARSEQGHTIVVSAYQFKVTPVNVSPGLLALETAEVPAEYRLFFDAPILAAYRYTARPFNLQLALSPLAQGDTLSLVVDRAAFTTRISKNGEVLTDARYFVKHRGNPHLRLTLPAGTELWSATVNGATVVPVKDGAANLIPLPQRADPNAVHTLDLKLASRSKTPTRVLAAAPIVEAPVLLAEWKLEPDTGQRLEYRRGSLTPAAGVPDLSGFATLARMFSGRRGGEAMGQLFAAFALVALALMAWRWAGREGTYRFSLRHLFGALVGLTAFALAVVTLVVLAGLARQEVQVAPRGLAFLAPVQQSGSALTVEVANVADQWTMASVIGRGWPALLALAVSLYALVTERAWFRPLGISLGWTLLAWAALRWPHGAMAFFVVLVAFLLVHLVVPALRRLSSLPPKPKPTEPPAERGTAPAVAALLFGALVGWGVGVGDARALQGASEFSTMPIGTPSPLNGERAGVRGENGNALLFSAKWLGTLPPHELQRALAGSSSGDARSAAPALAFVARPVLRGIQVPPRASAGALRPGFLLPGSEDLNRSGWWSARSPGTDATGPSEGKISPVSRHPGEAILELAGPPPTGRGEGKLVAPFAGASTSSAKRTDDLGSPVAHVASTPTRQESFAPSKSVAAESRLSGGGPASDEVGRQGNVSPLTPALSPLRGEGDVPRLPGIDEAPRRIPAIMKFAKNVRTRGDAPESLNAFWETFSPLHGERGEKTRDARKADTSILLAQAVRTENQPSSGRTTAPTNMASTSRSKEPPLAESVLQQIRVEEKFALATATIRWNAKKDQLLPLIYEPAVITRISYPSNALKLAESTINSKRAFQLLAQQDGAFDIEVQYQVHVTKSDGEGGFALPTQHGLVNRLALTLVDLDADVVSRQAVSIEPSTVLSTGGLLRSNSVFNLVLSPVNDAWIGWKPRSRDVKREKAVFFAEIFQLFVPAAGVVEGAHQVQVRPAQGELSELVFDVPGGATITDVSDSSRRREEADSPAATNTNIRLVTSAATGSVVSLWRFDPDTRKLRVSLSPPQSRPFTLVIRSQVATGPLPFEQSVGLLSVTNAAGQIGLVAVATSAEVQLDNVTAPAFAPINLEDFPAGVLQSVSAQFPGLTVRRAFRYTDAKGVLTVKASPVEPDVRVETQETLSLSEDRTVLAANVGIAVTRAGIFRLSFLLPLGLDVESISGPAFSHWTELASAQGRIITLHLKGKTEGQQQFAIGLAGPGTKATTNYVVPRLTVREASKQRGQLVIVPEQGMRLQVVTRAGVTQLDPQKSGIRQKGVLAFRLLQTPWNLALDIQQVDAWVQVTSLQHVNVGEAQMKVTVNLQYQIENTGLKALRVRIPTNAESVRFRGEQVSDFLPLAGTVTNELQTWEVKLHRRVLGKYLLQATYQTPVPAQATNTAVRGVQAVDVNLQRGFVTIQSGGRLQVRADVLPAALQPTEWQSIPRALQQDLQAVSANYAFRLVEPSYVLPLVLERHEAAKLLPARVNSTTLTSVISDDGVMLTEVRLEMVPGDKRLLYFTLPKDARFWFAFVNQNGVWPWREQDRILIPLEQQSRTDKPMTVELFYSSRIGSPGGRALGLELVGPKFELPLENITWRVYLNEKWRLTHWKGTLQLQEDTTVAQPAAVDVQTYLQNEVSLNRDKTRQAEELLAMGNTLLERGDPQQARRAFQSAYGLSTHDSAFNEDARVQLHNLKLQQALLGLNVRQSAAAGETDPAGGKLSEIRNRKGGTYTQQEAKQIIDANTADENAAFMRLAERLIQQQDAAVTAPAAIRAAIPQQGRLLTFKRAVQVDTFADLRISLKATAARAASASLKVFILGGVFVLFALLAWAAKGCFKAAAQYGRSAG